MSTFHFPGDVSVTVVECITKSCQDSLCYGASMYPITRVLLITFVPGLLLQFLLDRSPCLFFFACPKKNQKKTAGNEYGPFPALFPEELQYIVVKDSRALISVFRTKCLCPGGVFAIQFINPNGMIRETPTLKALRLSVGINIKRCLLPRRCLCDGC